MLEVCHPENIIGMFKTSRQALQVFLEEINIEILGLLLLFDRYGEKPPPGGVQFF